MMSHRSWIMSARWGPIVHDRGLTVTRSRSSPGTASLHTRWRFSATTAAACATACRYPNRPPCPITSRATVVGCRSTRRPNSAHDTPGHNNNIDPISSRSSNVNGNPGILVSRRQAGRIYFRRLLSRGDGNSACASLGCNRRSGRALSVVCLRTGTYVCTTFGHMWPPSCCGELSIWLSL